MYFGPSPVLRLPSRTEASKIVMVRTVEEALELQRAGTGQICMGEVRSRAPMGSILETRRSRSQGSISMARRSYSALVSRRVAQSLVSSGKSQHDYAESKPRSNLRQTAAQHQRNALAALNSIKPLNIVNDDVLCSLVEFELSDVELVCVPDWFDLDIACHVVFRNTYYSAQMPQD